MSTGGAATGLAELGAVVTGGLELGAEEFGRSVRGWEEEELAVGKSERRGSGEVDERESRMLDENFRTEDTDMPIFHSSREVKVVTQLQRMTQANSSSI